MYQQVFQLHADLFKALAHPRRLEIINLLKNREMTVGDMQEMLGLPQANISQHLYVLRKQAVVKTRKEGKQVFYTIADENFVKACDLIRKALIRQHANTPLQPHFDIEIADLAPIVTDPVCGMRFAAQSAAASQEHEDCTYYFCATGCKKIFKKSPKKYISKTQFAYVAQ